MVCLICRILARKVLESWHKRGWHWIRIIPLDEGAHQQLNLLGLAGSRPCRAAKQEEMQGYKALQAKARRQKHPKPHSNDEPEQPLIRRRDARED